MRKEDFDAAKGAYYVQIDVSATDFSDANMEVFNQEKAD
jgi:hypothetical protein